MNTRWNVFRVFKKEPLWHTWRYVQAMRTLIYLEPRGGVNRVSYMLTLELSSSSLLPRQCANTDYNLFPEGPRSSAQLFCSDQLLYWGRYMKCFSVHLDWMLYWLGADWCGPLDPLLSQILHAGFFNYKFSPIDKRK